MGTFANYKLRMYVTAVISFTTAALVHNGFMMGFKINF